MEASKPIDKIPKEDIKEDTKQECKVETKEETKEDSKDIIKETKVNKRAHNPYYRKFIREFNFICAQATLILLLLLLYINLYNSDIYDFIIYFCFGLVIAVMFIATFVLITKFNILSCIIYRIIYRIIRCGNVLSFCNKFLYLSQENSVKYIGFLFVIAHLIISITAFIYVKKYIKRSKKTNNAFLKSLILFCIWGLINIYVIDSFKVYNKVLKLTKSESTTVTISITITYGGLLYYFETLKNEKVKLINKLINK